MRITSNVPHVGYTDCWNGPDATLDFGNAKMGGKGNLYCIWITA